MTKEQRPDEYCVRKATRLLLFARQRRLNLSQNRQRFDLKNNFYIILKSCQRFALYGFLLRSLPSQWKFPSGRNFIQSKKSFNLKFPHNCKATFSIISKRVPGSSERSTDSKLGYKGQIWIALQ